ncbi:Gfo/Idh/MocA family oxidoreductase [bacterium]|nr:Gfo/Idh/MocA family oxidoreductase [bacterium]
MAAKLTAVLVGCGSISASWLMPLSKEPSVEIVGLVDLKEENAQKKAAEFNLNVDVGTDLQTMLNLKQPDIVFDVTVPDAHYAVTTTALAAGCHVLGEKPLADSMDHARAMVAAAEKAGKIYAVIQNRRYYPAIRGLVDFIHKGKIGTLTTVNSDFYIGAHFGGFRDRMQHVLLLDMAIHTFDAARFISGADPIAVYCHEWNPTGSWYAHGASAVATFEMSDGIVYTYRGSWCAEGLNTNWDANWHICGTNGAVKWNGTDTFHAEIPQGNNGFVRPVTPKTVPVPELVYAGHSGVIHDFLAAVQTGKPPMTQAADNIKSLAMVFGAIESAETGKRVLIKT